MTLTLTKNVDALQELQKVDDYRDRLEFIRDDGGNWHAIITYNGNGRKFMYGKALFRVSDDFQQTIEDLFEANVEST